MSFVVAAVDCEAIHAGWPHQPVNAWSSLVFVIVGGMIVIRGRNLSARLVGTSAALVGIGSLLFHGDHNGFSGWFHDWSIAALLVVLVALVGDLRVPTRWLLLVLVAIALLLASAPGSGEWVHAGAAVLFAVGEVRARRERSQPAMAIGVALMTIGAAMIVLGRTGGPWCVADSVFQPHSVWHAMVAAALVLYSVSRGWLGAFGRRSG